MTRATGRRCHALSFRYGQRHAVELAAAARVAAAMEVASHVTIDLDLRVIGGAALTAEIAVPQRHPGHLRPRAQHHLPRLRDRARRGAGCN
jgi:7-cyano-7-deazaguanine synthase